MALSDGQPKRRRRRARVDEQSTSAVHRERRDRSTVSLGFADLFQRFADPVLQDAPRPVVAEEQSVSPRGEPHGLRAGAEVHRERLAVRRQRRKASCVEGEDASELSIHDEQEDRLAFLPDREIARLAQETRLLHVLPESGLHVAGAPELLDAAVAIVEDVDVSGGVARQRPG